MMASISAENIVKNYGKVNALDAVSLEMLFSEIGNSANIFTSLASLGPDSGGGGFTFHFFDYCIW